eukprot:TRINITY_DN2879_c0_g1_i5.p1 TRINITY_DN2879_c0_g1~~TRINITY_DN2879_c0_g1_i5.p1  ORF type:complete len:346 (+),score=47.94 TRINITY_DN2879_c0_g1_i5:100-1137(+)
MTLFTAEGLIASVLHWKKAIAESKTGETHTEDDTSLDDVSAEFKAEDAVPYLSASYFRWLHTQGNNSCSPLFEEVKAKGWLVSLPELHDRRGPGMTCLSSLMAGKIGSKTVTLNNSKGCGGVMRAAPCGLIVHSKALESLPLSAKRHLAFQLGCLSSAITHSHPSGWLSGGCLAAIVAGVLSSESLSAAADNCLPLLKAEEGHVETLEALKQAIELASKFQSHAEATSLSLEDRQKRVLFDINQMSPLGGGWTGEEAIAISLYCCLINPTDCATAVRYAVNHGGDSDSTGAIAGNIVGALLGVGAVPESWVNKVELTNVVVEVARDLLHVGDGGDMDERLATKYV